MNLPFYEVYRLLVNDDGDLVLQVLCKISRKVLTGPIERIS